MTVLVDALDEAQDPVRLANTVLRPLADLGNLRLIVGTRRSTREGLDQADPDPDSPPDNELLEVLHADESNTVVLGVDHDATQTYAFRRLRAAGYAPDDADRIALAIGARREPILFARTASAFLARLTGAPPTDSDLAQVLSGGHRGLFKAAVDDFRRTEPSTAVVLRTLSLARGRGMPRATLHTVAARLGDSAGVGFPDVAVETAMAAAAPYITVDAEAGTSVYRLAHETYVEHFRNLEGAQRSAHGIITDALRSANSDWTEANYYESRYVIEHATLAEESGEWSGVVGALAVDAGWLQQAVEIAGVDQVADALATAHDRLESRAPLHKGSDKIGTVARALRRSRVAVAVDSRRLGPILHARLHSSDDPELRGLGSSIAEHTGDTWLEMTSGTLDCDGSLSGLYATDGTVRALAFGNLYGQPTFAIAIDDRVEFWDPRTSGPIGAETAHLSVRPTALALFDLDGQPHLAAAAAYEGLVTVYTVTGEDVGPDIELRLGAYADSVAVGLIEGDPVIAVAAPGGSRCGHWMGPPGQFRQVSSRRWSELCRPLTATW